MCVGGVEGEGRELLNEVCFRMAEQWNVVDKASEAMEGSSMLQALTS